MCNTDVTFFTKYSLSTIGWIHEFHGCTSPTMVLLSLWFIHFFWLLQGQQQARGPYSLKCTPVSLLQGKAHCPVLDNRKPRLVISTPSIWLSTWNRTQQLSDEWLIKEEHTLCFWPWLQDDVTQHPYAPVILSFHVFSLHRASCSYPHSWHSLSTQS